MVDADKQPSAWPLSHIKHEVIHAIMKYKFIKVHNEMLERAQ